MDIALQWVDSSRFFFMGSKPDTARDQVIHAHARGEVGGFPG